jgi:hypothetical protein
MLDRPDMEVEQAMEQLVRHGLPALPALLRHLDDARLTGLQAPYGRQTSVVLSDEYNPRESTPGRRLSARSFPRAHRDLGEFYPWGRTDTPLSARGVTLTEGLRGGQAYQLRVGDLCVTAVGRIVNRRLDTVRYQPTSIVMINSPVRVPALAAAVRADWSELTRAEHQASLRQDAEELDIIGSQAQALKRLRYYYPKEGAAATRALLGRPQYDWTALVEFVETRLTPELDEKQWPLALKDLERSQSPVARRAVPQVLRYLYLNPPNPAVGERALVLLQRLYPAHLTRRRPFVNAVPARVALDLELHLMGIR